MMDGDDIFGTCNPLSLRKKWNENENRWFKSLRGGGEEKYRMCSSLKVDAVFFGAFTPSRKDLCENVIQRVEGYEVVCFENLFGSDIETAVCESKVVFIDHAYPTAALEVHRILPLLAMGKAVIAVRSSDKSLDDQFADAVRFANSADDIPDLISDLLRNDEAREAQVRRGLKHVQQYHEIAKRHMCLALWDLDEQVRRVRGGIL